MYGGHGTLKNYFVWLIETHYSASDWTVEGSFCCICDLLNLRVSPLCHYRGKETVVPFQTHCSWRQQNCLRRTNSSWNIKLQPIVRVRSHVSASNFCVIFVPLDCMYCETIAMEFRVTIIGVLKHMNYQEYIPTVDNWHL